MESEAERLRAKQRLGRWEDFLYFWRHPGAEKSTTDVRQIQFGVTATRPPFLLVESPSLIVHEVVFPVFVQPPAGCPSTLWSPVIDFIRGQLFGVSLSLTD